MIGLSELCLVFFIFSNFVRSGGIFYLIVLFILFLMGFVLNDNFDKIGVYLMWVVLVLICIILFMFLIAFVFNFLVMEIVIKMGVNEILWFLWFLVFLFCGVVLILFVFLLVYKICKFILKGLKEVSLWVKKELEGMGKFFLKEILMFSFILLVLLGWILGKFLGLYVSVMVLIVMVLMVFCKIVSYEDIIKNKSVFNIFLLFGLLFMMVGGFKNVGFLNFIGNAVKNFLEYVNLDLLIVVLFIIVFFYLLYYFFVSIIVYVSVLFAFFVGIGLYI